MSCPALSFHHLIPAALVAREISDIERRLASTGYDPAGLDFEGAARQKVVRDVVATAIDIGVYVLRKHWQPRSSGAIDIAIEVMQDADRVALELALH